MRSLRKCYYSYTVMCDRLYGDASSGSLCQTRWYLSSSASDGAGDEEDYAVAAGVVG